MKDERNEFDVTGNSESRLRLRNAPPCHDVSIFRSYLQLMRLPNVFTAMADVAMGFLFVQAAGGEWTPTSWDFATLAALIVASSLLYIAGMVLNDVFDIDIDREERPERPIPSDRISLDAARRLGWRLLASGVILASATVFFTGHLRPGVVAALLATAILLYDAWLKRTPLGPISMGACRMLNVLLGVSVIDAPFRAEHWLVAGAIGVYVTGITWFARKETERSSRMQLAAATLVMMLGVAMLAWLPHLSDRLVPQLRQMPQRWYLLIGAIGLLIGWRCLRAIASPVPANVRIAVGQAILSIIMLDALVCYSVRGVFCAAMILLLWLPVVVLKRRIEMT